MNPISFEQQSAALELAEKLIRVNCVAPALVSGARADRHFSMLNEAQCETLADAHPLGLIPPQRIGQIMTILLSESASHITGQTLTINGGFSLA